MLPESLAKERKLAPCTARCQLARQRLRHPAHPHLPPHAHPLHPPPIGWQAKLALYTARYHLVHQRLRRNPLFRPPAWGALAGAGGRPGPECELSELKALLGVTGETRYVCGFLTQVR